MLTQGRGSWNGESRVAGRGSRVSPHGRQPKSGRPTGLQRKGEPCRGDLRRPAKEDQVAIGPDRAGSQRLDGRSIQLLVDPVVAFLGGEAQHRSRAAEDGAIRCVWKGKSSDRQPAKVLSPYFEELLGAASSTSAQLEMHFEVLEHFNSSTITTLIRLIQKARSKKVKLVMVYDQNLKWQRLSFDALRVFEKSDELFELRSV